MSLRFAAAGLIVTGLVLGLPSPTPAAADNFFFGFSAGHRNHHHGWRHHGRHHHGRHHRHHGHWPKHHHWGPRHSYGYYYAPPRIVHAPPPVIYYPAQPPLAAVPASPVYQTPGGQSCREYQHTVIVGGISQSSYGTACLQPDGSWRVTR